MRYVTVRNNVKIAVYDLNPCGRETVLMIHGWPLSHKIFEYQAGYLAQRGFRVVTLDLRGFGKSDAPLYGYCYNCLSDDIYEVVRALNLQSFTLVGFSMGGAIVLRYMRRHRAYGVKKLVLLGAAAPRFTQTQDFPFGATKASVDELIYQAETDRAQFSYDFSRKLLYSPHSEAILNWFQGISESASSIGTVKTGYSLRNEDGMKDLLSVRVPTGIFHGVHDEVVPFELGKLQHEVIRCSELFPFEESGHGVFYDELERFNQEFLGFITC